MIVTEDQETKTTKRFRGCLRGQANYTCTESYTDKTQCTTLESGETVSIGVLTGFLVNRLPTV